MAELDFSEIAKLNERYNKDPKSKIFVQLADAYRKNKMIDEALSVLNQGLQHHPNYSLAYLIQGKCYFGKRMFIRAKEAFESVLSSDPQNIVALRMMARTCESLKDEDGQISAYKGVLAIDPYDISVQEKLEQLEKAQRKIPIHTISMAQEYEKQGNYPQALDVYEYLLSTDPADLILQEKVKELKQKVGREDKKIEEEKIEGLQMETYFKPEDLMKKEHTVPHQAPPQMVESTKPQEEPTEKTEEKPNFVASSMADQILSQPSEIQPKETEEKVLPLEDFLAEEPAEKITEAPEIVKKDVIETPQSSEPQKLQKTEEPLVEPKHEEVTEEKESMLLEEIKEPENSRPSPIEPLLQASEPASQTPEVQPETPEASSTATAPSQETEEQPPKKPKEEDFQSFQEWLSGLLK